jgi:tripartite-type tricarboxylate transporter receptor subunit TctC
VAGVTRGGEPFLRREARMRDRSALFCVCALFMLASVSAEPASSATDPVARFYAGKQITMIIAGGAGGAYDIYARTFAQFLGQHIPGNPDIVPKNVPAAGGLEGASELYNDSDHDGLTFAALTSNSTLDALLGAPGARYDAQRFNWLGSLGALQNICAVWRAAPVKTFADLQTQTVIMGGSGATSDSAVMPKVLNALLGAKIKLIPGYGAGGDLELAVERGEIQGFCGLAWSTLKAARPDWIRDGKINVLLQMGINKDADLPNVPMAQDYVKDPLKSQVLHLILVRQELGRPFAMPPGVPPARVQALRAAFQATIKDPAFLAEAAKEQMELDPLSGDQVARFLTQAYATPAAVVNEAAHLVETVTTRP